MALTERYVSVAGGGAHDGTTEADAFTWAEMVTDINTPRAGYRYNVKAGSTYANAGTATTITGDGTATSPNIIRGYTTSIGDATVARSSGGALNTSKMPLVTYTGSANFNASGGNFLIVEAIQFQSANSGATVQLGTNSATINCTVANSSSNAAALGIDGSTRAGVRAINSDVSLSANSGGSAAIRIQSGSPSGAYGCRVTTGTSSSAAGLICRSTAVVAFNTIFSCGTDGIQMDAATGSPSIIGNTIYGCTGDGIDFVTSTTGMQTVLGNHITDNGGWGINFNTSTCDAIMAFNRFRDNTSGSITGGSSDWKDAGQQRDVTTDTGGASTDYTSAGTDFSLIAAAPGISGSFGYLLDIGANGTPVVTGGSGGGCRVIGG
jgi:hypothetical protein